MDEEEEFDDILASDPDEDLWTGDMPNKIQEDLAATSALSPEDEADLMSELAALEAEFVADAPATPTLETKVEEDNIDLVFANNDDADVQNILESHRPVLSGEVDDDNDVSRLLEQADDKLSDSETTDRRTEFAHLRAAMAAGKAEEAAGGSISDAASDGAYRDDLARVVKPRRPDADEAQERSGGRGKRPAPLKLVAAQRIDADIAPVQPRRIRSTQVAETSDDAAHGIMKFSDYASNVRARDLPELLEAAAAYLSFVEGLEHFSRPQLMAKVRMVQNQGFSREDGLRSFGVLLRDGKIEKTEAGQFTVSDRIGFRPEDMRAAG